jgi:hypothetical protein
MSGTLMFFLILPGLLLSALGGAWAQSSDHGGIRGAERPSLLQARTAEKAYTVPRKQVLLELFESPT